MLKDLSGRSIEKHFVRFTYENRLNASKYVGTRVIFCRTTTEIPDFAKYIPLTLAKIVDDAETPFLSETIGNKIIGIEWNERAKGTSILVPTTFANALHFLCNWMHLKL
jgi:hypothetical protein